MQQFLNIFTEVLRKHAAIKNKYIRANKEVWSKSERYHEQKLQGSYNEKIKVIQVMISRFVWSGFYRKQTKPKTPLP